MRDPVDTSSSPPRTVVVAALLCLTFAAVTAARVFLFKGGLPASPGAWTAWALILAYFLLMAFFIYRGHNWTRWWVTILVVLSVAFAPWEINKIDLIGEQVTHALQVAINVAIGILLFVPSAKRWFRPNNSFKPNPLPGST